MHVKCAPAIMLHGPIVAVVAAASWVGGRQDPEGSTRGGTVPQLNCYSTYAGTVQETHRQDFLTLVMVRRLGWGGVAF